MRKSRNLALKNSLVIVCEGTETEYQYFEDIADIVRCSQPDRYAKIRVVPTHDENAVMNSIRRSLKRGKRVMKQGYSNPEWLYYVMEDHSQAEYDRYREYPIRFVREAQLFIIDGGYTEAWAIYDKDVHTGHERARMVSMSAPQIKIAFSSYSFEEWILCHYERVSLAYTASKCKDEDCGIHHQGCRGSKCLIGRIREKKYIADFQKNMPSLFRRHLQHRMERACFNAAWLRHLDTKSNLWERNPYTDVDRLIGDLIGNGEHYEWASLNERIEFEGCAMKISTEQNDLKFIIDGAGRILLTRKRMSYCDETGKEIMPILQSSAMIDSQNPSHCVRLNKKMHYLRLEEDVRFKPRKVLFIELPFCC